MDVQAKSCQAALGGVLLLAAACGTPTPAVRPGSSGSLLTSEHGPAVRDGFTRVRSATQRFAILDSAVAAGYARDVPQCYSDAHHGAMGFHHVNRSLVDAKVEVEKPEILLYERKGDRYVMNGVEYIIPYSRWPRDSTPPTIMGLPLKQSDDLKLWYLHMWAWTRNPSGLFADWNPEVRCP